MDVLGAGVVWIKGLACSAFVKTATLTFGEFAVLTFCASDAIFCPTDFGAGFFCTCDVAILSTGTSVTSICSREGLTGFVLFAVYVFAGRHAGFFCTCDVTILPTSACIASVSRGESLADFVLLAICVFTGLHTSHLSTGSDAAFLAGTGVATIIGFVCGAYAVVYVPLLTCVTLIEGLAASSEAAFSACTVCVVHTMLDRAASCGDDREERDRQSYQTK